MKRRTSFAWLMIAAASSTQAEPILAGRILNPVTQAQPVSGTSDPSVSGDGRFLFFVSTSSNLGPPANGALNLYRADTAAATPAAESIVLALQGIGNGNTFAPSASGSGSVVAFETLATNLGGTQGNFSDVYVSHQITLPQNEIGFETQLVSRGLGGAMPNGAARYASISADGRFVAFWSDSSNLVAADGNNAPDVFVVNVDGGQLGPVELASVDSTETPISGPSRPLSNRALSADGRLLVFSADAAIDGASPGNLEDVFVRDRTAGTTRLVSKLSNGTPFTASSDQPSISSNGRYVAFRSFLSGAGISGSRIFVRDLQAATTFSVPVPPGATVCEEPKPDDFGDLVMQCGSQQVGISQQAWFWRAADGAWFRLSSSPSQTDGNNVSGAITDISANGQVVLFDSGASNLDPGDTNNSTDVFAAIDSEVLFGLFEDGFE